MLGPRLRAFGKSVWGIVSESASLCVLGVAQCVLQGCMCVYVACVLWQEFCRACLECPSVMRDAAKEEVKLLAFATIMDEASVAKCDEQAKALEDLEAKAVSDSYSGMLKGALVATGFGIVANMVKAELDKRRNQPVVGKSLGVFWYCWAKPSASHQNGLLMTQPSLRPQWRSAPATCCAMTRRMLTTTLTFGLWMRWSRPSPPCATLL